LLLASFRCISIQARSVLVLIDGLHRLDIIPVDHVKTASRAKELREVNDIDCVLICAATTLLTLAPPAIGASIIRCLWHLAFLADVQNIYLKKSLSILPEF
jgi:hypothetical protein